MKLEITTDDGGLAFALLGRERSLRINDAVEIAPGITATYGGSIVRRAVDFPEIAIFALSIPANIVATLAANQIWAWMQGRARRRPLKIRVDGIEVEFEEGAVTRVLIERIEAQNDNQPSS